MKQLAAILTAIKAIADNNKIWFRSIMFVVIAATCVIVGAIVFSKTKTKKEDC